MSAIPKDASAVIILDQNLQSVLWAKRNPKLKFLGGFHSFPGGKVDADDELADVRNCPETEVRLIACAAREVFEEIGVLLVKNGEKLTVGQRNSLHDDLISGRFPFSEILKTWGLWIDAEDFVYRDCWTTPDFSPVRFKTRFYISVCPQKQTPYPAIDELQNIEFITPETALKRWSKSKILIAPPVLAALRELKESTDSSTKRISISGFANSRSQSEKLEYIELNPRLICFPLRTKTLPPATHTNCFIFGKRDFVVIDAASKEGAEQQKLHDLVDEFIVKGYTCKAIIVSHLHSDHFGGEAVLKEHLQRKFGLTVPVSAHRLTAESLNGLVKIDSMIEDEEIISLRDESGETFEIKALHTPGHARGHLCFYDEELGFLLSSDNVVGLGSVLVAPPEGNMIEYLKSLERMMNLPDLNFLCGSHGSAVADAKGKIEEYIRHRMERENQILAAINNGAETPQEIAEVVYSELDKKLFPLALKSVLAHLEKIESEGVPVIGNYIVKDF